MSRSQVGEHDRKEENTPSHLTQTTSSGHTTIFDRCRSRVAIKGVQLELRLDQAW